MSRYWCHRETGNNDLPCDCDAGQVALFNVAGSGEQTGAEYNTGHTLREFLHEALVPETQGLNLGLLRLGNHSNVERLYKLLASPEIAPILMAHNAALRKSK